MKLTKSGEIKEANITFKEKDNNISIRAAAITQDITGLGQLLAQLGAAVTLYDKQTHSRSSQVTKHKRTLSEAILQCQNSLREYGRESKLPPTYGLQANLENAVKNIARQLEEIVQNLPTHGWNGDPSGLRAIGGAFFQKFDMFPIRDILSSAPREEALQRQLTAETMAKDRALEDAKDARERSATSLSEVKEKHSQMLELQSTLAKEEKQHAKSKLLIGELQRRVIAIRKETEEKASAEKDLFFDDHEKQKTKLNTELKEKDSSLEALRAELKTVKESAESAKSAQKKAHEEEKTKLNTKLKEKDSRLETLRAELKTVKESAESAQKETQEKANALVKKFTDSHKAYHSTIARLINFIKDAIATLKALCSNPSMPKSVHNVLTKMEADFLKLPSDVTKMASSVNEKKPKEPVSPIPSIAKPPSISSSSSSPALPSQKKDTGESVMDVFSSLVTSLSIFSPKASSGPSTPPSATLNYTPPGRDELGF